MAAERDPAALQPLIGRDPSWIAFDARVIALAEDPTVPLHARMRFLAISASNLDEYFMKRVARMKHRIRANLEQLSHDGKTQREQFAESRRLVVELQERQTACWRDALLPALGEAGVRIVGYGDLTKKLRRELDAWFQAQAYPILTPLAVHRGHRFPFISNLSRNIGVLVSAPDERTRLFARLKIPSALPAFVCVPEERDGADAPRRFVPIAEIVTRNLHLMFPGMTIADVLPFRVTRSTGVDQEEDAGDILENVEAALQKRRFAEPVRIEVEPGASVAILEHLLEELELDVEDVYERGGPLAWGDIMELARDEDARLRYPPFKPVRPPRLVGDERSIFAAIRERDLFVHHPYDSFAASVERFIADAARDPQVLAIKQTLYRTTEDSPFVLSLIEAAARGKQVACLVELRARFDEDRNLQLVRKLEKNGVHVTYGIAGVKTHCKCTLIVRKEGDQLTSYAHVGTGNYHPVTAQAYTDCGVFTCDPVITADVTSLFNYLTGRSLHRRYERLVVAPVAMRERFYALIDAETANAREGKPARIVAKMNQLEDRGIIERLYEASRAGVFVTLIVRGFCCLRPGVPGLSERITVLSILGRFLEHARIFHFADGREDPLDGHWMIGSADWMFRNIDERVEAVAPIVDRAARRRLQRILEVGMRDHRDAWELLPDGSYRHRVPPKDAPPESPEALGSFEFFCREAIAGAPADVSAEIFLTASAPDGVQGPSDSPELIVRRLLRLLVARPWSTPAELAAEIGFSKKRLAELAREVRDRGLVIPHRLGRAFVWEPSPAAIELIGEEQAPLEGVGGYPERWLRARLLAAEGGGETDRRRDVELGAGICDLVIGGDPASRTVWKVWRSPARVKAELEAVLKVPAARHRLIGVDAKTAHAIEAALADRRPTEGADVSWASAAEVIDATARPPVRRKNARTRG